MIPELLMLQLRHDAEKGALSDAFTGTTIKHLTRESLGRYKVPVPPLPEQKRIADKLDALLTRVEACRERLVGLLRRALLSERRRGRAGHWAYDLARHGALLGAWRRECAALEDIRREGSLTGNEKGRQPLGRHPQ